LRKIFFIWWNITYPKTIALCKMSSPQHILH